MRRLAWPFIAFHRWITRYPADSREATLQALVVIAIFVGAMSLTTCLGSSSTHNQAGEHGGAPVTLPGSAPQDATRSHRGWRVVRDNNGGIDPWARSSG
ncbi:MAG: hypothetical protein GWO02_05130 [Gammaproteobacteria bacterium]|nr:hypothetical protein [Gammaproteobacteria bacterium]